jgi:uncharacterized protein Veg
VEAIWYGRVLPGGLLVLEKPKDYNRAVRSLAGKHVELTIRKRKTKRSSQQNKFYWSYVLVEMMDATGYTKDEAHEALKYEFLREDGDGPLRKVRSTTSLTVEEFSAYVERVMAFGAIEFGIVWESREKWEAA